MSRLGCGGKYTRQGRKKMHRVLFGARVLVAAITLAALSVVVPTSTAEASGWSPPTLAIGGVQAESTNANAGADPVFRFFALEIGDFEFGRVSYATTGSSTFEGTVDCVERIDDDTVAIGGPIFDTNVPTWTQWIAWVHDEPGSANDWIRVTIGPGTTCETHPFTLGGVPSGEQWSIIGGRLKVR